jgi:hypothetical protein
LIVQACIVDVDGGGIEGTLAVSKISSGQVTCRVGFIARNSISKIPNNTILQVIQLYEESESKQDRRRSHRNGGMALCKVLGISDVGNLS